MATGVFDTYDTVGIREDLADRVWDVSPTDRPISSSLSRNRATATKCEFQTHVLNAPAHTPSVEGADAGADDSKATVRLDNYTQIVEKVAIVSKTNEAVNAAGRDSEMSFQIANRMDEILNNVEFSLCGRATADAPKAAGSDTVAREMGAFQAYLSTNVVSMTDGSAPAGPFPDGTAGPTNGTTQAAFTEAKLKEMLQLGFDNGSKMSMLIVNSGNKGVISTFDGGTTVYNSADDRRLVAGIDMYEGDFHNLRVMPSRMVLARDVLGIDPEYADISELQPLSDYELGVTGQSWRRQVAWEGTLRVLNEQAHGAVYDTTGAA